MTKYFNMKTVYGTETVDELSREDFKSLKEFSQELKRLRGEYHLAGMQVYTSSRACKDWNTK